MTITQGRIPGPLMDPDLTTWNGRLEHLRKWLGLSARQMAIELGYPVPTFQSWLNGTVPTKPSQLEVTEKIAETFNVDKTWIAFGGDLATVEYLEWLAGQRESYGDAA